MLRRVCVFCGSSFGRSPLYIDAAKSVGRLLADRKLSLVYGGARIGLMGAVADACLESGGKVIGVIPVALVAKEIAHGSLTELRIVDSMHERKAQMADLADAFIALPGGYGTWEEFWEVLTWSQLGLQAKPCALLNVSGYYDPFLTMADRAVQEGFLHPAHRRLLLADSDGARLLDHLSHYEPSAVEKWIGLSDR